MTTTTTTLSPAARKLIDRVTDDARAGAPTQALLDALCDGAYLEQIDGIDGLDTAAVEEAYAYLEDRPISYRYEIRGAHRLAWCGLDARIAACYLDSFSFEAGSDDEALYIVEDLQLRDDTKAAAVCKKAPKLYKQLYRTPCYEDALWRLARGAYDEDEKVEA
jgi:hypothetical protein